MGCFMSLWWSENTGTQELSRSLLCYEQNMDRLGKDEVLENICNNRIKDRLQSPLRIGSAHNKWDPQM